MTFEELQAEFPHGSRWSAPPHVRVITGWQPVDGPTEGKVQYITEGFSSEDVKVERTYFVRRDWHRIPDPVPCPITEPVTLTMWPSGYIGIKGMADSTPGQTAVTLLPDGRYTWEGGPE